jgi:hypothetical protein
MIDLRNLQLTDIYENLKAKYKMELLIEIIKYNFFYSPCFDIGLLIITKAHLFLGL